MTEENKERLDIVKETQTPDEPEALTSETPPEDSLPEPIESDEERPESPSESAPEETTDETAADAAAESATTPDAPEAAPEVSEAEPEATDVPAAGVNAVSLPDGDVLTDEQLSDAYDETLRNIQEGEVVRGVVLKVEEEGVLVDVGYKSEGIIPLHEFDLGGNGRPDVHEGQEIDVYLVRLEDADGLVVLSKTIADQRRIWEDIAKAYEEGRPVKGVVTRRIKGGLRVEIGSMYAFLPASQVDIRPVQDLDAYMGRTLEMKVIKLNRRRRNIVLSRRVLLEEVREQKRKELLQTLEAGQVRTGIVKNITQFGAFIDLGGLDGLLHKSDMSWGRVGHPSEVVERDQEVQVMVLSINRETGKVSLGLKQLTKDPWENIAEKYPVGSNVTGRVVNIVDYGAFVELEEGVEGLIHVSEMSWTRRNVDPHHILQVGEEVTVRVLNVDADRQKISLGLKQLRENPWDRLERDKPVGSRVSGRVRNITDFGVFVEIEEGIDGLIHVSDLSWTKRVDPEELFREGDDIEVIILDIDRGRERVSLGLKQLEPDPWLDVPEKYKVGTIVEAQIVNLTNFGAFAKLEDGIEGLIHISELSEEHIDDPGQVVRVGDHLEVKVINLDLQERRIGLSRKAYILDQHRSAMAEYEAEHPPEAEPEERPHRRERTERPPRPERRERDQERERPERVERAERGERGERTTLGDLIDQARREFEEDDDQETKKEETE